MKLLILTKVVLSCFVAMAAHAQEDLSELDQIDAETAPALKEPKVDMSKKSQNIDTSATTYRKSSDSSTCPVPDCLCKCVRNPKYASSASLHPSFKGIMVGSACVCPCMTPKPTAAEIIKASPYSGALAR